MYIVEWLFDLQLDRFESSDEDSSVVVMVVMMEMNWLKWISVSLVSLKIELVTP